MPAVEVPPDAAGEPGFAVEYSGKTELRGEGPAAFTLHVPDEHALARILSSDAYSAALAYIRGEFNVSGDLISAIRVKQRSTPATLASALWSLASFENPSWSLERAQEARFERICRLLELRRGERFLDVGCGWGGLLMYAAERYGVRATGCTLSRRQHEFAANAIARRGLRGVAAVREMDYRDLSGRFDKIASIGMFEHVGRHRLGQYFRKIFALLEKSGLFLNSGIVRPQNVQPDPQTWFLLRHVFPGGELEHLANVVREAERSGFAINSMRSLRKDYARTCRRWVERLRAHQEQCVELVGTQRFRTWLLYLAASALNFEQGQTDVFALLMTRP